MKQTEIIMGMPITIEIIDKTNKETFKQIFDYFKSVDNRYSTYMKNSEISKINRGLAKSKWSKEMKEVISLCDQLRIRTKGYFNINHNGKIDPSGLVKGWSINNAAKLLKKKKIKNFYIEAGGDIQVNGTNADGKAWKIGIRNPYNMNEIIKVLKTTNNGIATSGTYIRGQHIYDPHHPGTKLDKIKSITVVGPNIYDADCLATAAYAMGKKGINYINSIAGFEAYMVDNNKKAIFTPGFERFVVNA